MVDKVGGGIWAFVVMCCIFLTAFIIYLVYIQSTCIILMTKLCKVLVYRYTYLNIGVLSSMEHIFQLPIEIFKWEA